MKGFHPQRAPRHSISVKRIGISVGSVLGVAVAVGVVNWVWNHWFNYPFAYCAGRWLFYNLGVAALLDLSLAYLFIAVIVVGLWRWQRGLQLALVYAVVAFLLPMWADTLFRLGGFCSEAERKAWGRAHQPPPPMQITPAPPKRPKTPQGPQGGTGGLY